MSVAINSGIVERLLASDEPSVRYRTITGVAGIQPDDEPAASAREQIRTSARVKQLLAERDEQGRIPVNPYSKWFGAHWVLSTLADLGYPPGDETLIPLREQVLEWLLGDGHARGIVTIEGKTRRCASQEGNALYALLALGLADARAGELAGRLISWQWPDGGWNCDRRSEARVSSFMESLIPLRALALYARETGDREAGEAAGRTIEIFLGRRLFRRRGDGSVVRSEFTKLHYPCYWHYDVLFGLKVMAEAGVITDERCSDALELLESKRLPGGGFPATGRYYREPGKTRGHPRSPVDWGGVSATKMNEFVTVDALYVLKSAGRDL